MSKQQDVLKFWLERGVDGFRVDAIQTLFEVEDVFLDEPVSNEPGYRQVKSSLSTIMKIYNAMFHSLFSGYGSILCISTATFVQPQCRRVKHNSYFFTLSG